MLDGEQLSRLRMQRRALQVAMSVRPDFRPRAVPLHERIVGRRRTVGVDAHDLADRRREVLRPLALGVAVAGRHVQRAVAREREARAPVIRTARLGHLAPDHLRVLEAGRAEPPARHRGTGAALAGLREAQVHEPVGGERRRQRNVEQPALPAREHARHARKGRRKLPVLADDAQASLALGDEHAAVGQEREAPRVRQAPRDHDGADRRVDDGGRGRARRLGPRERGGQHEQRRDDVPEVRHGALHGASSPAVDGKRRI